MPKFQLTKTTEELQARFLKRSAFPIKARGPITALDWDGSLLRAAQSVERGGRAEIVHLAAGRVEGSLGLDQPEADAQAIGGRLARALHALGVKPGAVVMGIPRGVVFLRTLSLPKPQTPSELAAMVNFQISKDLPFRAEEAIIDFQVNGQFAAKTPPAVVGAPAETPTAPAAPAPAPPAATPEAPPANGAPPAPAEKLEVLVAVVKKEVVEHCQRVARAAGFTLAALGLDSYANARSLEACEPSNTSRNVALVTLRQAEVIIDVICGGVLVFSRTAPLAGRGATTGEAGSKPPAEPPASPAGPAAGDIIGTLTIETVRSLHNYEGLERHEPIQEILVVGAEPGEAAVAQALAQQCHLPCRLLDPAAALGLSLKEPAYGPGALTVLGLALSAQDQKPWPFDFLHPKRPPAPRDRRREMLIRAAAVLAALVCVGWCARAVLLHGLVKERNKLQAEIKRTAGNAKLYKDMGMKAKAIQDWTAAKREWLDHYAYLSLILPGPTNVYVTSISVGTRGVMHLSIQARSGEILAQMDKRLRAAGYELRPLAITPCSDKYGFGFQSSLELTLPDKLKVDLAALTAPDRPADEAPLERARPRAGAGGASGRDTKSKAGRNRQ